MLQLHVAEAHSNPCGVIVFNSQHLFILYRTEKSFGERCAPYTLENVTMKLNQTLIKVM